MAMSLYMRKNRIELTFLSKTFAGEDHDEQCDVCSLIYPGPEPFSEVEARNIRDYVLSLSPAPTYANSYHSFGNMILFPFGFQKGFAPHNYDEMVTIAEHKEIIIEVGLTITHVHDSRKSLEMPWRRQFETCTELDSSSSRRRIFVSTVKLPRD